ncbi:MAG: hypothetical protein ACLTWD_09765 [Bacteroides uniformis]
MGPGPRIAFLRKAWQKKIPERSEDDFLLPTKPLKGAALRQKRGNPRPLPLKSGKTVTIASGEGS